MKFLTYNYNSDNIYWPFEFDLTETIFFDIETTGFLSNFSQIYLIGAIYYENGQYILAQWFSQTKEEEASIINAFIEKAKKYKYIMHFNGNTFDLPFIGKKCETHNINNPLNNLISVDLYRLIQKFRKPLTLGSTKQKIIETFLGINREDKYTGGELIKVYSEYLKDKDDEKMYLLLLHNHDDMLGMPKLLEIFKFNKLLECKPVSLSVIDISSDFIIIKGEYNFSYPAEFSHNLNGVYVVCYDNIVKIKIDLIKCTLKHFFQDYKNYYYLPLEDMAIHKSVAVYVDKDFKCKATKDNCYVKKEGTFLKSFSITSKDIFRESYNSAAFIEYTDSLLSDIDFLYEYYNNILKEMF